MSIPFGNETVTLVKRNENVVNGKTQVTYSTSLLTGCSWHRTTRIMRNDNALISQETIVCRVPAGQAKPNRGDLMILGASAVTINSGVDYQRLVELYQNSDGAFVVTSVTDNARPGVPIPHYAVRGA